MTLRAATIVLRLKTVANLGKMHKVRQAMAAAATMAFGLACGLRDSPNCSAYSPEQRLCNCLNARLFAFRHIVLAVRHGDARWGALGLSREDGLQWKLLAFGSLGALLSDYREAYARCGHEITKVRIGLPMPHDDGYKGKARPACGSSVSALTFARNIVGRCYRQRILC